MSPTILRSSSLLTLSVSGASLLAIWGVVKWMKRLHGLPPYPPGPPIKNIITGNLADLPSQTIWLKCTEWKETYGNLVHLRIFGQHIIVVNTYEDAIELFEKRSNIYSDRPHLEMIYLMGWDFNSALKHYGDDWRQHRRLFQQLFKREVSIEYQPIQTRKVNDMLYGLLTTPEDFIAHAKTVTAAIIVSTMYGHDITPKNDYFVTLAETALAKLREAVFPGALAVNAFPILKYLPTWFPGAGFKRFALGVQDLVNQMLTVPIEALEKRLADGTAQPCVSSSILEDCKSKEEYEVIEAVAATAYAGGSDTTVSVIETFFLAMTMFPEAQKKAQDEIDKVVGNGRMPTYDDRESLPLIEAFVRELLRWRPVTPLGVWHASTEEDIYNGYYLRKGATFFPNVWAMAHNPQKYDRPEDFNPDRFFGNDSKLNDDEVPYAFGFGRRLCPGRYMASATIWLSVATVLALFNIQRTKDADGNEVCPEGKYCDELALHPLPFECYHSEVREYEADNYGGAGKRPARLSIEANSYYLTIRHVEYAFWMK